MSVRRLWSWVAVFFLLFLAGVGVFGPPEEPPYTPASQAPTCTTMCEKAGVNFAYPVRQPTEDYLRAERLGMGWSLEIAYHPSDLGRTIEAITRAHDHNLRPILRICAGSECAFDDPAVYAQFLQDIAEQVDGEFWALMGPNEPDLEPWAGDATGVANYMNAVIGEVETIPNLRMVSPAFNLTNGITDTFFNQMEAAGARFADLDAFTGTSYCISGNGSYYYYAYNLGHSPPMRQRLANPASPYYGMQIIFVEYGTFGMFDKPGEDNPARIAVVQELRTNFTLAANDPTVLGILHFDAFGTNGSPHELYDDEMIEIGRETDCTGSGYREAGIGITTDEVYWQLDAEPTCREIQYGCPFVGGSACPSDTCFDNDGDAFLGDGGECVRNDCDDLDPAIGLSCDGGIPDVDAPWGTLRTVESYVSDDNSAAWPILGIRHNGLPLIAYHDARLGQQNLNVLDCTTPDCTTALRRVLTTENRIGLFVSMAIRQDGTPLIAHLDLTDHDLEVFDCHDPACATGQNRVIDYSTGHYGFDTSMAIRADGRPIIAYWHSDFQDLRVFDCADTACSAGEIRTLDSHQMVGYDPSIIVGADMTPLISYTFNDLEHLRLFDCVDQNCTGGGYITLDNTGARGFPTHAMIMRNDGRPIIVYRDTASGALMLYDCATSDCTIGTSRVLDATGDSYSASIALLVDDSPFVAYSIQPPGGGRDLRLLRCLDPTCAATAIETITDDDAGQTPDVIIRPDGNPLVVYHDVSNGDLVLYDVDLSLVPGGHPIPVPTRTPWPTPTSTPTNTPTPTLTPTPTSTPTPTVTPVHALLEHQLGYLYSAYLEGGLAEAQVTASEHGLILDGSRVMVTVLTRDDPIATAQALTGLGGVIQGQVGNQIFASLPINGLLDAANLPDVGSIVPSLAAVPLEP